MVAQTGAGCFWETSHRHNPTQTVFFLSLKSPLPKLHEVFTSFQQGNLKTCVNSLVPCQEREVMTDWCRVLLSRAPNKVPKVSVFWKKVNYRSSACTQGSHQSAQDKQPWEYKLLQMIRQNFPWNSFVHMFLRLTPEAPVIGCQTRSNRNYRELIPCLFSCKHMTLSPLFGLNESFQILTRCG